MRGRGGDLRGELQSAKGEDWMGDYVWCCRCVLQKGIFFPPQPPRSFFIFSLFCSMTGI